MIIVSVRSNDQINLIRNVYANAQKIAKSWILLIKRINTRVYNNPAAIANMGQDRLALAWAKYGNF